jgi:hypothetical protein
LDLNAWILAFIAFDAVVMVLVALWIVRRKSETVATAQSEGGALQRLVGVDFRAVSDFANGMHGRVGEYVRARWSGIPDQLPGVLSRLVDELEADARQRGVPIERDLLKRLVERSLDSHGIVKGNAAREALRKVA